MEISSCFSYLIKAYVCVYVIDEIIQYFYETPNVFSLQLNNSST